MSEHAKTSGVGPRIREAREHARISQAQLARDSECASLLIWKYEALDRLPRADILLRIAEALHVSTDWLLTGKGKGPRKRTGTEG